MMSLDDEYDRESFALYLAMQLVKIDSEEELDALLELARGMWRLARASRHPHQSRG